MSWRIPLYLRKEYAKRLAKYFILQSNINSPPVDLFAVCQHNSFIIKSVSQLEDIIYEVYPFHVRENPECDAKSYLISKYGYLIIYDDVVSFLCWIIWYSLRNISYRFKTFN